VPDALRKEIAQRLRVIRAPKGRTLVEKGSTSADVFFVLEGRSRGGSVFLERARSLRSQYRPRRHVGELAVLGGGTRSASIVASSELVVAVMRAPDFMKCIESSPAAGIWLARGLASSVRRATEQIFRAQCS